MSNDPPPPYPGGPSAPLIEEKHGPPSAAGTGRGTGCSGVSGDAWLHGSPCHPLGWQEVPGEGLRAQSLALLTAGAGFWPLRPHMKTFMCVWFSFPGGYYPPPGPHPPMGYYPAPGHYPSPGGHTATVLVPSGAATTVTVLQGEIFQGAPVQTVCPHCQQAITTKITYEIGLMSFLLGFLCCFVGCDLCCCLIPCLFDDFKDVTHTCPNCKAYIYTYKRMC
ncbi:CDIP1 protein, partial [Psophia crepitans]|nr:CDIP1 protein [Psophia crepitans]